MAAWRVYLFGTPRLEGDCRRVEVPRRKQWALLAYLLLNGDPQGRDVLATLLWPQYDQRRARADLRRELARLRAILGEAIVTDHNEVFVGDRQAIWVDVDDFARHFAAVHSHAHAPGSLCVACREHLFALRRLYAGHFLAGFTLRDSPEFDDWQFFTEETYRTQFLDGLDRLADLLLAGDEWDEATACLRQHLAIDPLHEKGHRQLMELYARSGQRAAAIHQFGVCQQALANELHTVPSEETVALFQQIAGSASSPPARSLTVAAVRPQPHTLCLYDAGPSRFVGRQRYLDLLHEHLAEACRGHGHILFVAGEVGTGKTALLSEFARQAMALRPDLIVTEGCGTVMAAESAAYVPFRDVLAVLLADFGCLCLDETPSEEQAGRLRAFVPQVARSLALAGPDLIRYLAPGGSRSWQQAPQTALAPGPEAPRTRPAPGEPQLTQRTPLAGLEPQLLAQYTAVILALAAQRPLLLFLDNLQWFDRSSSGLLFHLSKRIAGHPILIAGAYRPSELLWDVTTTEGADHPLRALIAEAVRDYGEVKVDLDAIAPAEARAWLDAWLDLQPNQLSEAFRAALCAHTGGHPLFTREMVAHFQAQGWLKHDPAGAWVEEGAPLWGALPARVSGAIQRRIDRVDAESRRLLDIAAAEGEIFTAQTVAAVRGCSDREALHVIAATLHQRHRLVCEHDEIAAGQQIWTRYRFANPLIRSYLVSQLDHGELRLLRAAVETAHAQRGLA